MRDLIASSAVSVSSSISERSRNSLTYSKDLLHKNLTVYIKSTFYPKIKFCQKGWGEKICKKAVQAKSNGVVLPVGSTTPDFVNMFASKVPTIFTSLRKASEMNASKCIIGKFSDSGISMATINRH